MTFSWINDNSTTQTCCWSVTNARIIELNNGNQQYGNTDPVFLGDMCISGTSYECTDNTIWLCSESSLSQTPPATVELRSNSFTLGESASDVSVNSNCSSNNNIPSTNPPGLISCDILTPSSSSSSTQQTTSTSTINSDTALISSDTSMISSDTSTISSDTSMISSTSVVSFVTMQSPSPSNINLQTCNTDGDLWSQTPVGTNVTGIGTCYNGTVNGELLIMTDRNTD